jgi:D-arabinose 1-dehydrogenase-like Zn-dependent alcohol dehydrogenase
MPRPETMRAVIFKGVGVMTVEDRPTPQIQQPQDAILKVTSSALCGSDLVRPFAVSLPANNHSISIVAT